MKRKFYIIYLVLLSIPSLLINGQIKSSKEVKKVCPQAVFKAPHKEGIAYEWDAEGTKAINVKVLKDEFQAEISWSAPGKYTVFLRGHQYKCYGEDSIIVEVVDFPNLEIEDTAICEGTNAKLTVKNSDKYDSDGLNWMIENSLEKENKTYYPIFGNREKYKDTISMTIYGIKSFEGSGLVCHTKKDIDVTINPLPEINLGKDTMLCEDGIDIRVKDLNQRASWTISSEISNKKIRTQASVIMISPEIFEQYLIADIVDANMCENSDTLKILPCSEVEEIKTVFTPNGDGSNDKWIIPFLRFYPDCKVEVFDRWGRKVFSSSGYDDNKAWDGRSNGNLLPMDSYYYVIDLNNGSSPLTGHVTIIR